MIVSRPLYEAALLINQSETVYVPGHAGHEGVLAAGIACLNGVPVKLADGQIKQPLIELTHKGEEVIRLA